MTLLGKKELIALHFFGLWLVYVYLCHGLFFLPLGIIGRLLSVIVTISGHLLYNFWRHSLRHWLASCMVMKLHF